MKTSECIRARAQVVLEQVYLRRWTAKERYYSYGDKAGADYHLDAADRLLRAYEKLRMAAEDWADYETGKGPHPKEFLK